MKSCKARVALCFPPEPRPHYRWNDAWKDEPLVRHFFEDAEKAIHDRRVSETSLAQVHLYTVSVAAAHMLRGTEAIEPVCAVPHSVGLYAALVDTGAWSFHQGLDFTITAGEFINDFTRNGEFGMAAILGFPEDQLHQLCEEANRTSAVELVGHNAPRYSTIAGKREATEKIIDLVLAGGATDARFLPSPAPLHTSLVRDLSDRLRKYIADWSLSSPRYPLIHPSHARITRPDEIHDLPADHIVHPVRWREAAGFALSQRVDAFIETGGVKVLSKFVSWIDPSARSFSIIEPADLAALPKRLERSPHESA